MKINELLHKLNKIDDVHAYINNGEIVIEDSDTGEYYLHFNWKATTWPEILLDNVKKPNGDYIEGFYSTTADSINDIVTKYLKTPIAERENEKYYVLPWIGDSDGCDNYIYLGPSNKDKHDKVWGMVNDVVTGYVDSYTFSESELNRIKKEHPQYVKVIDYLKREVPYKEPDWND